MFKVTILILFSSFLAGLNSEEIKVIVERNVAVPMRDGTILRADIHRPDRGGAYPVLVYRTQYGKGRNYDRFVKAGYIVVDQDVRGRYKSEGQFESFHRVKIHDAQDGYDTVEWAAKLPGSSGKVGTVGNSDLGMRQWPLAALHPASLKAMSASRCIARITDYIQGIFPSLSMTSVMPVESRRRNNRPGVHTTWEAKMLWEEKRDKWIWWLPWSELPQDVFDDETDAIKYLVKHPSFDPLKLDNCCKDIVVPNLSIYGWFDKTASGDILLFQTMVKEAKSEVARQSSRLIIGPWTHSSLGRRIGNIDFGPHAEMDQDALQILWFDYWLKGKPNGIDKNSPVSIFVMGDNEWRDEQSWPLYRAEEKVLYIMSDGSANTPVGNGCLTETVGRESGTDQYEYDPTNPVLSPNHIMFPSDQRRLAERQDVLVYQTEPLKERTEVTGEPVVDLYAASSAPDTDWIVRLIDVYPDGLVVDVSHGFLRARYRNGLDKPELIKSNEVIKYVIRMRPTSNAFLPGHRIRLDITSSDFPHYDRNHNTAADQYADATLMTAHQTIYHGGEQATRITLPWVPNPIKPVKPTAGVKTEPVAESEEQIYPLHQAATDGDIERVKLLISEGTDINTLDEEKSTPLCCAIKGRCMEVVQLLVEADADINAGKWPPLYVAVDVNDIAMARYLISHGANANPSQRWTPLHQTPYSSSAEMAELLIDNGADVNAGRNKVWEAAIDKDRVDILEKLIQKGMDLNTTDGSGISPLAYALTWPKENIVDFLLANGADIPPQKNKRGITPLHNAAILGQERITDFLLANGAEVDERDDAYEFTALHYAARFGSTNVAEVLIAHGADIRAKDKWGYEPIHWAAYHDRPQIIELLIAKGADVNAKTSLGQTPLDLAIPRRNTASTEVLRKYSNDMDSDKPYVVLERGNVKAVIVNNEPVDDEVLPGHRGGYSGVASLTHRAQDRNLFVPFYAGLNFEHILDGTNQTRDILFEPRRAPMQIKQINDYTAVLYQPPTPHWQLESRLRYQLLEDGVIEMTLECIPCARTFKNDYIGLFFASYIDKPELLDIHFLGRATDDSNAKPRWIRGVTPEHGVLSTHLAAGDNRNFAHDPNFPLTLVFNKSNYRYTEPWYYGVSHGMALVLMFRPKDNVRLSQSPSGGGDGNPAWDFQWFVPQYEVGKHYRFVMRAMYLPFESTQQIIRATVRHRAALEQ